MRYIFSLFLLLSLSTFPLLALKKTEKKIPDYSNTERDKVPVEYTWKLEDVYPDLAAWKADREKAFKLIDSIDEKARDWTSSPQKMLELFDYISEIEIIGTRLYGYASQHNNVEMSNTEYQQLKGDVRNLFIRFGTKIAFLQPDILKLGKETFDKYLKEEPKLEPYRQKVDTVLRMKDHILSVDKEQLITMTGLFSGAAQQASEMLNNVDIPKPKVTLSDGKTYELNYPTYSRLRESKNPEDRMKNMATYWGNHKLYENTFSILIDGEMKLHLFNSKIRNYKNCLEAALYYDNINTNVYLNLIKAVRANLDPLHRYLRLKQKLLGIEKLKYPDIYASAVKKIDKEFEWEEAEKLIMDSMLPLGPEYQKALKEGFAKRWIDRYPNKDKESGAYSNSVYGIHPYIKMNYTGNYSSVSTLAHELGHSLHSYFSDKTQHYANHDYSSFLAEIASTFNENLLMKHLLKKKMIFSNCIYLIASSTSFAAVSIVRHSLPNLSWLCMNR
jgi:oligoendopeptidase F